MREVTLQCSYRNTLAEYMSQSNKSSQTQKSFCDLYKLFCILLENCNNGIMATNNWWRPKTGVYFSAIIFVSSDKVTTQRLDFRQMSWDLPGCWLYHLIIRDATTTTTKKKEKCRASFWKCNFPMTSWIRPLVGLSVGWLVSWMVCQFVIIS